MEIQKLRTELEASQKREEALLLKTEELTDFIENAALPLHWVDGNGIIIWANQAELNALGYKKEEYLGRHINEFHADQPTINDILKRLLANQTLQNYPARLLCKDRSIRHVLINSNVLWKDDKFIHTRCFTRDITELKTEEEKRLLLLKELEEKNAQLKASYEDLEVKVKFRNLELEKTILELQDELSKRREA